MKTFQAKHSTCSDPLLSEAADNSMVLTVKDGSHIGAKHPINVGEIHVIGSGQDCEMILMDEGVALHHCFISRFDNKVTVRTIDKTVMIGDEKILPGQTRQIKLNEAFVLGSATILLEADNKNSKPHSLFSFPVKRRVLMAAFVPMLVAGVAAGFGHNDFARAFISKNMSALDSEKILNTDQNRHDEMTSTIEKNNEQGELTEINTGLQPLDHEQSQIKSDADVFDPLEERIADDVSEILRLSGIASQTRYLGDGQVEVTGYFGDGQSVEAIIRSRAIRDINGLVKVIERNLDAVKKKPRLISKKHISRFVGGVDPYLVISDGSRYYLGAELPGGGQLVAIDDSDIVVKTKQGRQRFSGADAWLWE